MQTTMPPQTMTRALTLEGPGCALQRIVRARGVPQPGQILIGVRACGVCRTDLHILDGELPWPGHPVIPGHEVVGTVLEVGTGVESFVPGDRVGVPWLGWTCGRCRYCLSGRENLCDRARFSGYQIDGGYADHVIADARYSFRLPSDYGDAEAAPLPCAGLIGYRALVMAGEAPRPGGHGFGAAAHIVAQLARHHAKTAYS